MRKPFGIVLWIAVFLNFCTLIFLGHLVPFHLYLQRKGLTTFEYIKIKEDRKKEKGCLPVCVSIIPTLLINQEQSSLLGLALDTPIQYIIQTYRNRESRAGRRATRIRKVGTWFRIQEQENKLRDQEIKQTLTYFHLCYQQFNEI